MSQVHQKVYFGMSARGRLVSACISMQSDYCKSEIFARVLFSQNFAYGKFREKKKPCEMPKSLCRLLIYVSQAQVVNSKRHKCVF